MSTTPPADESASKSPDDEPRQAPFTWVDLVLILAISLLVAAIVVPNVMQTHHGSHEASAVGALKTITTAQSVFREGDKENDGNLDYGMLSELSNVTLIDSVLGKGTKQGYFFEASYSYRTSEFLWFAVANPQVPTSSGDRYFVTSAAGVIFYTTSGNLSMDTNTCALPVPGMTQVGK